MPHAIISGDAVPSVELYTGALNGLLDKARQIKSDGGIEPALTPTDFDGGIEALETLTVDGIASSRDARSSAIEISLRKCFYDILSSTSINDPSFTDMWSLLDISVMLSDNESCEINVPYWFVEELLESQTLDGCRKVFDYLESRREAMVAKHYRSKHLMILRACNELLKRLSRAEDTVFCGRVFIYLFSSLAFGDRSSVNLRGEFHVANTTSFDEIPPKVVEEPMAMDVDNIQGQHGDQVKVTITKPVNQGVAKPGALETKLKDTEHKPLDLDSLYPIFWSLQECFSKPNKLFEAGDLLAFKSGLEATLVKFKQVQRESDSRGISSNGTESKRSAKRKWQGDEESPKNVFNPKYLTNRDLFGLEIVEQSFQRHILVQSLIVLDFLLSLTPKAKAKLEHLKNKSVIYPFTLDEAETKWAEDMKRDIEVYISHNIEGKLYYRMVDTVLSRDKNWVYWKAEGCPLFSRTPVGPQQYMEARNGAKKASQIKRPKNNPMGALILDFLKESNTAGALEKLRNPDRYTVPAMDFYKKKIETDDLDMEFASDAAEKAVLAEARSSKLWRTLRVASRKKFSAFDKIDDGNKLAALFTTPEQEAEAKAQADEAAAVKAQAEAKSEADSGPDRMEGVNSDDPTRNTLVDNSGTQEGKVDSVDVPDEAFENNTTGTVVRQEMQEAAAVGTAEAMVVDEQAVT